MKNRFLTGLAAAALITGGTVALSQAALAATYEVTITNATKGQPLAPGLVIVHDSGYALFEIGDAPSFELAIMAETGDPHDLESTVPGAHDTAFVLGAHGGIALPSEFNSVEITSDGGYFTAVGMLAATNDAFYAVRGVKLPETGAITVYAPAYDAGSEANNEKSGDVPASRLGNSKDAGTNAGDGEGYIHIHSGIFDVGQLKPWVHGWNNPVVAITIELKP